MADPSTIDRLALAREAGPFAFRQCRHGMMAFLRADVTIGRAPLPPVSPADADWKRDYARFLAAGSPPRS